MSERYTLKLVEKRLVEIERELSKLEQVIEERAFPELCDTIQRFNESRDIDEKMKLAKEMERLQGLAETWVERSDAAWKKKMKLHDERQELQSQRFYLSR